MVEHACNRCKVVKSIELFPKCSANGKQGVKGECKQCSAERRKKHYAKNREHELAKHVAYREENLEELRKKRREYQAGWVQRNFEVYTEKNRLYDWMKRASRDAHFLESATNRSKLRRAATKAATPMWADFDRIREIYREARRLTLETGVKHEVDHIIPVQGKIVTGLHVPENLRVVTKAENRRKSNKVLEALL